MTEKVTCLADKLYNEGYHIYGAFSEGRQLAGALSELALDVATGLVTSPKISTLEETLLGKYRGKKVFLGDGNKDLSTDRVYTLYAKPVKPNLTKGKTQIVNLILSDSGETVLLRGIPFY